METEPTQDAAAFDADVTPAIQLVAVDLDGTLLDDTKQVADHVVESLAALREREVKVVLATARPPRSVRHVYGRLRLDTLQINYNGALIWDEPRQSAVFHCPMPGPLVRQMIHHARGVYSDLLVSCEVMDRWFTDRFDQTYTTETGRLFRPDVICPADEFCNQEITKLMFLGHPELIDAVEPMFDGDAWRQQVTVVRCDRDLIQIMDRRVSKAVALQQIAAHYGIPMHLVMAIGDAPNDVGMLQSAGVAVAVDNAHARCKQVAHWIAPSNNDHGVHAALVRYGLA